MAEFFCDLGSKVELLPHFWEECVGGGHSTLALRADYQAQLKRCHEELGFKRVRFHGLFLDEIGMVVKQDSKTSYSFFNPDVIGDFLSSIGMCPFVEFSFMPTALASDLTTVFRYRGNVTPPCDYKQWEQLIRTITIHWRQRYGAQALRNWLFEVWNEPNLRSFWRGSQSDYFKLYRFTAEAVKQVDASLRLGGPATAQNAWIPEFLRFCQHKRVPVDFLSTHHYPNDPPLDRVSDKTNVQLAHAKRNRLLREAQDARRSAGGKPLYYSEWNSSSDQHDPLHDEPYAAAFIVKTVLDVRGLVSGYSYWVFSDIFAETEFPSKPFHGGFGLLNAQGIPKPAYRAFQLLHELGNELLLVDGLHPTVNGWVIRSKQKITVLLSNHALPGHLIERNKVEVTLHHCPKPCRVSIQRIDDLHANPTQHWRQMGQPATLTGAQVDRLLLASTLKTESLSYRHEREDLRLQLFLPPQAVAAIQVELQNQRGDKHAPADT